MVYEGSEAEGTAIIVWPEDLIGLSVTEYYKKAADYKGKNRMMLRLLKMTLIVSLLTGCVTNLSSIEAASVSYKQNKDYGSLEQINNGLFKGMRQNEVERLLGEPDYSPIDGQYYYTSDRSEYSEEQMRKVAVGLVVDYRDVDGRMTERLQEFRLGLIAE